MTVAERTIAYESYRLGSAARYLLVDAAHSVPDRGAFVRDACRTESDAEGVLFLSVEDGYAEPRVVVTFVSADGVVDRVAPAAAGCAAAWAVRRLGDDDVLLDTQTGTYRAAVDGETVTVDPLVPDREVTTATVHREREGELPVVPVSTSVPGAGSAARRSETERVVSEQPRSFDDD